MRRPTEINQEGGVYASAGEKMTEEKLKKHSQRWLIAAGRLLPGFVSVCVCMSVYVCRGHSFLLVIIVLL